MRIGTQGSGSGQVNSTYIAGVTGASPVDANSPQLVLCDSAGNFTVIVDNTPGYVLKSNYPNSPTFQDAGSAIITINVDQSWNPVTGSTFSLFSNSGSANCGSSRGFINLSGNGIDLVVTDASNFTIFGSFVANSSYLRKCQIRFMEIIVYMPCETTKQIRYSEPYVRIPLKAYDSPPL